MVFIGVKAQVKFEYQYANIFPSGFLVTLEY